MRRRTIGLLSAGFGAFLVAAAVTLVLVGPSIVKIPLDQNTRTVATGFDLTVFYPKDLTEHTDVNAAAIRNVIGDPTAAGAGPDVAVWNSGVVVGTEDGTLISTTTQTACLDRRTGAAVNPCPSARLDANTTIRLTGQQFGFPIGTGRQNYDVFDPATATARPARYLSDERINGVTTYRFEQQVPETVIERRSVAGNLVGGAKGATVTADVVYSAVRTLWVEPVSGTVVKTADEIDQYLRGPGSSKRGVTLLRGAFLSDDATVTQQAARADDSRNTIELVEWQAPAALGGIGAVLVTVGLILLAGRRWSS
jgi:hypothetical protein